jgi:hypothetical protein
MRTNTNRSTQIDILGNSQGRIVVTADVVRVVMHAQLFALGHFFQAFAGYLAQLKRATKSAATGAAHAAESAIDSLDSSLRGLPGCWQTLCVMPRPAVERIRS